MCCGDRLGCRPKSGHSGRLRPRSAIDPKRTLGWGGACVILFTMRTTQSCIAALCQALTLTGCASLAVDGYPDANPGLVHQSETDGVPYFENLHWDMTRSAATALYPDIMDEPEKGRLTPRLVPVLHRDLFEDCGFRITLGFFPAALIDVSMELEKGEKEKCHERLISDLKGKFGSRPKVQKGKIVRGGRENEPTLVQVGTVTYVSWFGNVTTIILQQTEALPSAGRPNYDSFGVSFLHTGAPGTFIE